MSGAGSNPPAGGSSAFPNPATNPPAGGSPSQTPAQHTGGSNPPAAGAGSNPPAGGSSNQQATHETTPESQKTTDENAPVSADIYREKVRSEAALRRRLQELEQKVQAQEDAKLSEQERLSRRVQELERDKNQWVQDRRQLRLQRALDPVTRELNLVDSNAALTLFLAEFADQIDWDDDNPLNADYLFRNCINKYSFLKAPPASPQQQTPNAGRAASPPRAGGGGGMSARPPAAHANAEPKPTGQWSRLSDIDWTKPGG
jgi:hypothetical protein